IEAWVKRADPLIVSHVIGDGEIFAYGSGGYSFGMNNNGTLYLTRMDVDNVTTSVAVTDTNLHHLAVTKSGSVVVFYIDGVAYNAPAYNPTFVFNTSAAIGARGDSLNESFLGTIDEVSIYNRGLSALEVQAIYTAGSAGKCTTGGSPPAITSQPANQTTNVNGTASFSVTAIGTLPLSYQWLFNGAPLAGQTSTSLALSNVQGTNAGNYSVVVSNVVNSVLSSNAVLTVLVPQTSCTTPPAGLVSWWRGEGNALDQAGTNNGTLVGNTTYGADEVGQGFVFDGNGDAVSVGNPANLRLQNLTIEAWVKRADPLIVSHVIGDGEIFAYGSGGY